MIRLGVAGHLGYDGLSGVLATLQRLAPALDLTLSYEESIGGIAGPNARLIVPGEVDAMLITYMNRLSDLLFVLARVLARDSGFGEVLWKHERRT